MKYLFMLCFLSVNAIPCDLCLEDYEYQYSYEEDYEVAKETPEEPEETESDCEENLLLISI